MKLFTLSLLVTFSALASDLRINDYNWSITDITSRGFSKERLYSVMDRDFIKTGSSICSNRAQMWAHNFKENYDLNTAKIFLFYTKKKNTGISEKTWWYHVSPLVNENNQMWVMDAGFPGWINSPMTIRDWLFKFSNSYNCKEINARETDLVEMIFAGQVFPHQTSYGYFDCYYKIVPHTLWTPETVAKSLLGKDSDGRPIHFERPEIDKDELYQACLEATTSKIGYAMGSNKKKCKEYAGIRD